MLRYRDMRNRVNGKPDGAGKEARWEGLPICSRDEFIHWAMNDLDFQRVWNEWHQNNFVHRGPTVHRVDREGGYVLGNMQYMSHAEKNKLTQKLAKEKRAA
jgi:hypothetical protein